MATLQTILPVTLAAIAARYWPFANGAGRIIDRFARTFHIGTDERLVETSDGFSMCVFADDLIDRHLIMSGRFDGSVVDMMVRHARAGDVRVDMGANIGYVSAWFMARDPVRGFDRSGGSLGSVLRRQGYSLSGLDKRLLRTRLVPVAGAQDSRLNHDLAMPSKSGPDRQD